VESGDIVLIGATTENPSFEVNAALLSRSRVVVLKPLAEEELLRILTQALTDEERGLGSSGAEVDEKALRFLAQTSDGDARTALNVLELAVTTAPPGEDGRRRVDLAALQQAFARKALLYDRAGEEHFNVISALHKSIRNSDADAGLYWLARMLEAGEDPLYVARRLVRFASPPRSRPCTSSACPRGHSPSPSWSSTSRRPRRATLSTSPTARRRGTRSRPGRSRCPSGSAMPRPVS
jgi:putative ATPase